MSSYGEKLKDPRWQKKRLEILERDGWTCQVCRDTATTLHVHHRYYLSGREPWDVPAGALVTLCEPCHEYETDYREQEEDLLLKCASRTLFADDVSALGMLLMGAEHWSWTGYGLAGAVRVMGHLGDSWLKVKGEADRSLYGPPDFFVQWDAAMAEPRAGR